MGKINWKKVDTIQSRAMGKIEYDQFHERANASIKRRKANAPPREGWKRPSAHAVVQVVKTIQRNLVAIKKISNEVYKGLASAKKEIQEIINDKEAVTEEQWRALIAWKTKIGRKKSSLLHGTEEESSEAQVNAMIRDREKKKNRHNLRANKKWNPI